MTTAAPHGHKAFWKLFQWGAGAVCAVTLAATAIPQTRLSTSPEVELVQLEPCSSTTTPAPTIPKALKDLCEITEVTDERGIKRTRVKIFLTAQSSEIEVAGYKVITENYNGTYLSPIIEANPGDIVAARLINNLDPRDKLPKLPGEKAAPPKVGPAAAHIHASGQVKDNVTNLHFFHGGVVTPRNDRSDSEDAAGAPGKPKGDNVYVVMESGAAPIDYQVPIPGDKELHGGVLDDPETFITHPTGLNWYHSHLHGISADQVTGGLSGLLSVGDGKANVVAKCPTGSAKDKCEGLTEDLKKRTIVRYAMLRDILLKDIKAHPEAVSQIGPATTTAVWKWNPPDFFGDQGCPVYKKDDTQSVQNSDDKWLRKGYCQPYGEKSAWLFTLNGQRFPTITVESGKNLLLRLGNLSANVAYWLELYNESDEKKPSDQRDRPGLSILSLDGVVPGKPVPPDKAEKADVFKTPDLLLMPASRAEIYVQNERALDADKVYILGARLDTGIDKWPEVQLARIKLKAGKGAPGIPVALNTTVSRPAVRIAAAFAEAGRPPGCARDLEKGEYRLVTFLGDQDDGWRIKTEIMMPPKRGQSEEKPELHEFTSDEKHLVGGENGWSFEKFEKADGTIDWTNEDKRHVCVRQDGRTPASNNTSYQQLWVLQNKTGVLHNFHIHQMKFRLATKKDFEDRNVKLPKHSSTCSANNCDQPNFKLYEAEITPEQSKWHDTIPVPPAVHHKVYLIMSFTADEQVGRFVFHCHVLKHEDMGLMAPIEVWARFPGAITR